MAYFRKLPSGKWQATVWMPNGKRITKTDKLKKVVQTWATEQESKINAGDYRDPRAGQIKIGIWRERVSAARNIEAPTRAKHDTLWRTHCKAQWAEWPMAAVTRMEAQEWANRLTATRRARHRGRDVHADDEGVPLLSAETIHACVSVMSKMYSLAMKETPPIVISNPFLDLDLPEVTPRPVEFYEQWEVELLYEAIQKRSGVKWRAAVELGMDVGLRPGEIFGLHATRVDWRRQLAYVRQVMTRYGLRDYPKSKKSHRTVPIPEATLERMSVAMRGRDAFGECTCPKVFPDDTRQVGRGPCPSIIFAAPEGGPMDDGNFRDRIWYPGVKAAGIRRLPPKIMRHTAASLLVQDGVPLYDVQALLGHEDPRTTQRYAHLAPDAHDKVKASWKRRADQDHSDPDASVTHEMTKAHS